MEDIIAAANSILVAGLTLIVGGLTLIVTIIISFQIYAAMNVEKCTNEAIDRRFEKNNKEIDEKIEHVSNSLRLNMFFVSFNLRNYTDTFAHLISLISKSDETMSDTYIKIAASMIKDKDYILQKKIKNP